MNYLQILKLKLKTTLASSGTVFKGVVHDVIICLTGNFFL